MATFQRLNLDATWLAGLGQGVLFDPWLIGSEIDGLRAFHEAWHTGPVCAPSAVPDHGLIVVSQPFADHCHPQTLRGLPGDAPLAVVPAAASAVRRALPHRTVHVLPPWGDDPLVVGALRLWRLSPPWFPPPAFHVVVVADDQDRAVVHAPHGLTDPAAAQVGAALDVRLLACSRVPYRLPALLGGINAPGPDAADAALHALHAHAAFALHDEDKRATGLVPRLAQVDRSVDPAPAGTRWMLVGDLEVRGLP